MRMPHFRVAHTHELPASDGSRALIISITSVIRKFVNTSTQDQALSACSFSIGMYSIGRLAIGDKRIMARVMHGAGEKPYSQ